MPTEQRLTARQAETEERRRNMTQQRRDLSHRIRKQKRSEYLARKRSSMEDSTGTSSGPSAATSSQISSVQMLVKTFCSAPSMENLEALHQALQTTTFACTINNSLVILESNDEATAKQLLEHLYTAASTVPDTIPTVLQILIHLSAISSATESSSKDMYYYGTVPITWSNLLNSHEPWLKLLVQLAPQVEKACIILGNLVGEANPQAFQKLHQARMVPALVSAVRRSAAAWALTNAIRQDTTEWATTYCNDQALSADLLQQLLQEPRVAVQAAWMLASLTNREKQVVQYLMNHPTFPSTLVAALQSPVNKDQVGPLLQTFGNIATTITTPDNDESGPPFSMLLPTVAPTLVPMIGSLLQTPHNREVVQQAAWLAGCLLNDAGMPDHPATTHVAPVLVPILLQELRDNTPHTVDNQREFAVALESAIQFTMYDMVIINRYGEGEAAVQRIISAIPTLVRLATSIDADAVVAALSVLSDIIVNAPGQEQIRQRLLEANLMDVLEDICQSSRNEDATMIASEMLDTLWDMDFEGDEEIDDANGGPFDLTGFGAPPAFGNDPPPPPSGMGRGRGATLPAWMTQQPN